MNTILQTFQGIAKKQNTFGLLAVTWGAGLGCALSLCLTVLTSYAVFRTQTAVETSALVVAGLTLTGSLAWILMEWLSPSVKDASTFVKTMRNAAIGAFFMPLLLVLLVFVLCTWKMFLRMYTFIWLFIKQTKSGEDIRESLHSHHCI